MRALTGCYITAETAKGKEHRRCVTRVNAKKRSVNEANKRKQRRDGRRGAEGRLKLRADI